MNESYKLELTVGASTLPAEGGHVLRDGVRQQQADVHSGAPLHCQSTQTGPAGEDNDEHSQNVPPPTTFLTLYIQPYMSR